MILGQSQYFGLAVSVAAYLFAAWLRKKTKLAILNPLLISSALIIGCLVCVGMDYETYNKGAGFLGWLLTPATVCLAIPLYRQLNLLRQHGAAVLISILAGVATSAVSVFSVSYTHLDVYKRQIWRRSYSPSALRSLPPRSASRRTPRI